MTCKYVTKENVSKEAKHYEQAVREICSINAVRKDFTDENLLSLR